MNHGGLLGQINNALEEFITEMKSQNLWDSIVLVSVSDFGRTLTSNGLGTDHAWGGNHFMLGGAVRGGRIHGQYPTDLSDESELNLGRGRLLPTLPWEGMWHGIARWMGVEQDDFAEVLPNYANFVAGSTLLTEHQLFEE
eukprot:SAG31_NODE_166_length_21670_cov_22.507719_18_plen_140_part_00